MHPMDPRLLLALYLDRVDSSRAQELLLTPSELRDRAFQSWLLAKNLENQPNLYAIPMLIPWYYEYVFRLNQWSPTSQTSISELRWS